MARQQLGQSVEARKTLEQLRDVMKDPQRSNAESNAFLEEAAALIERPTDAADAARPLTRKQ